MDKQHNKLEVYNIFEGVLSDHRINTTKIRLSLRSNKQTNSKQNHSTGLNYNAIQNKK